VDEPSGGRPDPESDALDSQDTFLIHTGLREEEMRELLALASRSGVTELELQVGDAQVRLRRAASAPIVEQPETATEVEDVPFTNDLQVNVTSPLVGIFRPRVRSGETVAVGQSLGRVEALGMPTVVDAPHAGIVEELLVADGGPVEYGAPLLLLRRTSVEEVV
jgi:acetyl-CoA carboxylase biotin carboxyl carrier protein